MVILAVVQAVPTLMFWEVRRKDFWENMAHHIATIGLITYSYQVKCGPSPAKEDPTLASECKHVSGFNSSERHAWYVSTQTEVGIPVLNLRSAHEALQPLIHCN